MHYCIINSPLTGVVHIANVNDRFYAMYTSPSPSEMFRTWPQSTGLVKHPVVPIYSVLT